MSAMGRQVLIARKKHVPLDPKSARLVKILDANIEKVCDAIIPRGHAEQRHAGMSDITVMNDLLARSSDKDDPDFEAQTANTFLNRETMRRDIEDALRPRLQEIAQWRTGNHAVRPYDPLALKTEIIQTRDEIEEILAEAKDETIPDEEKYHPLQGMALLQTQDDICLTHCTEVGLILTPHSTSRFEPEDFSFGLLTAYPRVEPSAAIHIPADLTDLLKKTPAYMRAPPLVKAVWEYKAALKPKNRPHACFENGKTAFAVDCCPPRSPDRSRFWVLGDGSIRLQTFHTDKATGKPVAAITNLTAQNQKQLSQRYPAAFAITRRVAQRTAELSNGMEESQGLGRQAIQERMPSADEIRKRRLASLPSIAPGDNDKEETNIKPPGG